MKTGIIIQARLGSSRLQNKMIIPFYENKGILELLLIRLVKKIDIKSIPIILATTKNSLDDKIVKIGERIGVTIYRGEEHDVLDRFIKASINNNISKIIRICADNPLLDMEKLGELIEITKDTDVDYCSFATSDFQPAILTSFGFWSEYVTLNALQKVALKTKDNFYREHVTNFIYNNQDEFKIKYIIINPTIEYQKNIRLTVDTRADFKVVKEIYAILKEKNIGLSSEAIVNYIALKPNWQEIMKTEILTNKK